MSSMPSEPPRQEAFDDYRQLTANGLKGGSLLFHYARLIELLYCLEKAEKLLENDEICGRDIRIHANPANREGVGVIEAPRGTLIHHYRWINTAFLKPSILSWPPGITIWP